MINLISKTQKDILNGKKVNRISAKQALKILKKNKKKQKEIDKLREDSLALREKVQNTDNLKFSKKNIQELKINWANIFFHDGKINFNIHNHFTQYFSCPESKNSYNLLKKFFIHKNLNPLIVSFKGAYPVKVKNLDELNKVIEILSIENYLRFGELNITAPKKININKIHLSKSDICRIYNLYNKTIFFEGLIELQDDELKIIPVPEIILNKKLEIINLEESFLFSCKKGTFFKIIWESVIEKKATYIFTAAHDNYEQTLQKLFDFISSPLVKNKRDLLIHNIALQQQLMMKKRIKHDIPKVWLKEIEVD